MNLATETVTTSSSSDTEQIKSVLDIFIKGWNTHDVTMFSSVFAPDADFTNVMGTQRKGRHEVEALHAPLFKTIWNSSTQTIHNWKIRFVKPDVASVDMWWKLEGLKTPEGADRPGRHGLIHFIMTRHESGWMIDVMHNMDLPGSGIQKC